MLVNYFDLSADSLYRTMMSLEEPARYVFLHSLLALDTETAYILIKD